MINAIRISSMLPSGSATSLGFVGDKASRRPVYNVRLSDGERFLDGAAWAAKTAAYNIGASEMGKYFAHDSTTGFALTLPKASTVPAGTLHIVVAKTATSGSHSIAVATGDKIVGSGTNLSTSAPLVLSSFVAGDVIALTSDGVTTWTITSTSNLPLGALTAINLAANSVINWGSSDATLTHSTNTLTFAGATVGYVFNDGPVTLSAGAVGTPSLTTSGDLNTGLYFPAADTLGLTTGGVARITCNSDGVVVLGTGDSTATPSGNTLRAPHAEGTNIAGGNISFSSGRSTGTAGGGAISFSTSPAGGVSGTTLNASVTRLQILSTGNVVLGSGEASATVAGNTFRAPNAAGTDIAGANLTITSGNGTGTGGSGYIAFQTAAAGSTGTTANTMTERMRISKAGVVAITGAQDAGDAALPAQIFIYSEAAYNASPTVGISGVNKYNAAGNYAGMGGIKIAKENATDGNWASYVSLATRPAGSGVTERLRVTSTGDLAIGATAKFYLDGVAASGNTYLTESAADTISLFTNGSERLTIGSTGNVGINTTTFGTSAAGVLGIKNGTEPSTGPADTVQVYSVDLSAGNTIPAVYCEGTGVTGAGITSTTVTHKIALKVNGTVYYLLATTNAT